MEAPPLRADNLDCEDFQVFWNLLAPLEVSSGAGTEGSDDLVLAASARALDAAVNRAGGPHCSTVPLRRGAADALCDKPEQPSGAGLRAQRESSRKRRRTGPAPASSALDASLDDQAKAESPSTSESAPSQITERRRGPGGVGPMVLNLPTVAELLAKAVSPAAEAYVGRSHVSAFVRAARAEPLAPVGVFNAMGLGAVARAAGTLSLAATRHAAELRVASAALRASGDCDAPAWQLGQRVPSHGESVLHALQLHMHALTAALQDGHSPNRGYEAMLGRPLSAPERAHVTDITYVLEKLHTFLSSAQGLLAELRCQRGSAVTYLECSAGILDLVSVIGSTTQLNNQDKIAEFADRASTGVVWPTTYMEHAKAAGCTF